MNWDRNQPSSHDQWGNDENCAEIYTWNGKWNDQDCTQKRGYICQRNPGTKWVILWLVGEGLNGQSITYLQYMEAPFLESKYICTRFLKDRGRLFFIKPGYHGIKINKIEINLLCTSVQWHIFFSFQFMVKKEIRIH